MKSTRVADLAFSSGEVTGRNRVISVVTWLLFHQLIRFADYVIKRPIFGMQLSKYEFVP